jgi:OOP family OmpA-OmpF porin
VLKSSVASCTNILPYKFPFVNIIMLKKIALGLGLGIGAASALSQTVSDIKASPAGSAYIQNSNGVIVRTENGMCWRTGFWTPADAVPGCDGPLVPPIAKPIAPAVAPPPPVAQAPAAPAAPSAPVVPKRCDFSVTIGDAQSFGFNSASLTAAAERLVEATVLRLLADCAIVDTILVTGHTDSIGSHAYNQKLSAKRANAVATYLKDRGITAQVNTSGAGETQPVTSCEGKLPRATLLTCMAPDRRVEVEVRGVAR